jgi:DNA invertase Pin-like site-specific DNA recombinase
MNCYSYARVSSKHQVEKHGLTRQINAAKKWAEKRGYQLEELTDKGLSAYKGDHIKKDGALGGFLAAVAANKIPRGSILIVEAIDRLSRQSVMKQIKQFISLLEHGIEIVTLADNMHFTEESVNSNWTEFIISISMMAKANEESKHKGRLIKAAKVASHGKAQLGNHILTKQIPFWCFISDNKIIENDFADTVRKIFTLSLTGLGAIRIARQLNNDNTPCYKAAKKSVHLWNSQKVNRILRNPRVYGLYVATGDYPEIEGYFPEVINKHDFMTVQGLINNRDRAKPRSSSPNNIFSGVIDCTCGANYSYGYSKTGRFEASSRYIRCNRRQHGENCDNPRLWYYPFERLMLSSILELQYHQELEPIDDTIAYKAEIHDLEVKNELLVDLIVSGEASSAIAKRSKQIEDKIEKLKWKVFLYKSKKAVISDLDYNLEDIDNIQDLANAELREKTQHQIRSVVDKITINDDKFIIKLANQLTYVITPKNKNSSILKSKELISNKILF